MDNIEYLLRNRSETGCADGGMTKNDLRLVLKNLQTVLENKIEGDVVELGCYTGWTSVLLQQMLDLHKSNKNLHLYDSFEGLPERTEQDDDEKDNDNLEYSKKYFFKGALSSSVKRIIDGFNYNKLKVPKINKGFFKDIPDDKYPNKICFALFDGDFYSSIMDSFDKTYHKMAVGGIIQIDDYGHHQLPGVKKACDDFLKDKPEKVQVFDSNFQGVIVKQ
jgi:O-methyltransferase